MKLGFSMANSGSRVIRLIPPRPTTNARTAHCRVLTGSRRASRNPISATVAAAVAMIARAIEWVRAITPRNTNPPRVSPINDFMPLSFMVVARTCRPGLAARKRAFANPAAGCVSGPRGQFTLRGRAGMVAAMDSLAARLTDRRAWAREAAFAVALGVFFALIGPFGSYDEP